MTLLQCREKEELAFRWATLAKQRDGGLLAMAAGRQSLEVRARHPRVWLGPPVCRRDRRGIFSDAPSGQTRSSRLDDLGYAPASVVWASIARPSAPSMICTLRGFADSATGMRSVSTPVS
jgi:hypothetical protein